MNEEVKLQPGYWAAIPAVVRYDTELSSTAKLVYAEISALADKTGYCYATNAYFMQNFDFSERTLQRILKMLCEKGYIAIVEGSGGDEYRKIYAGINPAAVHHTPDKNVGAPRQKCRPYPDKNVGENNINNNNNPPISPQGDSEAPEAPEKDAEDEKDNQKPKKGDWKPERFARLWDFYPHKARGCREKARKAWNRLKPDDETIALMGRGMQLHIASEKWQEGIGIPMLGTYLNNRYWEDALEDMAERDDDDSGWAEDPEVP